MSDTAALLGRLREAGAELKVQGDGQLLCTAPKGMIGRELVGDLRAHKPEIMDLLAMEAVEEYSRVRSEILELCDAFEAAEDAGETARAEGLEARVWRLGEERYWPARLHMLSFGDEILARIHAPEPNLIRERPEPPAEVVEDEGTCRQCGGTTRWKRKDGSLVCAVCHPDPNGAVALALSWTPGGKEASHA